MCYTVDSGGLLQEPPQTPTNAVNDVFYMLGPQGLTLALASTFMLIVQQSLEHNGTIYYDVSIPTYSALKVFNQTASARCHSCDVELLANTTYVVPGDREPN